jgi:hypothetical protein
MGIRLAPMVAFVVGCAQGGLPDMAGSDASPQQRQDAHVVPGTDAPIPSIDAPVTSIDAPVTPIDAAVDAAPGLFCNSDTDCTAAGTCCFDLGMPPGFCVSGTDVLGVCVPS